MAGDLNALNEDGVRPNPGLKVICVYKLEPLKQWTDVWTIGFDVPESAGRSRYDIYAGLGFDQGLPWHQFWVSMRIDRLAPPFFFSVLELPVSMGSRPYPRHCDEVLEQQCHLLLCVKLGIWVTGLESGILQNRVFHSTRSLASGNIVKSGTTCSENGIETDHEKARIIVNETEKLRY